MKAKIFGGASSEDAGLVPQGGEAPRSAEEMALDEAYILKELQSHKRRRDEQQQMMPPQGYGVEPMPAQLMGGTACPPQQEMSLRERLLQRYDN